MKHSIAIMTPAFLLLTVLALGQTSMKEYKAGHVFYVSLPTYMTKTTGMNDAATIQFKNTAKDVAGFIIEDNKEDLELSEMVFSSIDDFYATFIKDFLSDKKNRKISQPSSQTIGDVKFMECDESYYDKESKLDLNYFVGIAETKDAFYKLICFSSVEDKDKFKADFQKILYSIRD